MRSAQQHRSVQGGVCACGFDFPIVKRSQYQFLVTMLTGGVLMCCSTVIYSGAPSRVVCALRPASVSWAFTLIFGSLVVKSMRVYRVFLSSAMKRVVLSAGTMMKALAGFLAVDIVILVSWELVSPSDAILKAEAAAEIGGLDVERLRCASSSSVFVGLLFFWKAVMLFGGLYLSILIRKVSSDFQESVWIFASASALTRREKSTLSYRVFEDTSSGTKPTKTALVMHGILGNKLNWRTFSQKLTKANPDWRFVCLDLRGDTDYASRDLTNSIETILPVVKKIPLPIRSKAQLVKDLQSYGVALGEAQWLTTNLRLTSKSPELYEWKMDVDVIEQLFRSFLASDLWPVVDDPPSTEGKDVEIHFVHASKNNMWTPELLDRLDAQQENQVYHHLLEKSGHWVHIDNPIGLMKIIETYMLHVTIRMPIKKDRQTTLTTMMHLWLYLLLLLIEGVSSARLPPALPRQFQAEVQVLSHLTDPRQEYPPSIGRMKIQYDFDQQLARAEMLEGYNAGKTYVRRYDQKQEFMVKSGEFRKCERAYLGDAMPVPEIPFVQEFVAMESVRGKVFYYM
eukprot:jgi/Phyca11/20680/fgenesh1_pg.PHYCAscaffold_70_\